MSKGKWKKGVCSCGECKKCKDRARLAKKKLGLPTRTISKTAAAKLARLTLKTAEKAI